MRNYSTICLAACVAGLAFSLSASAAELRPSGDWRVDYGEAQCVALRDLSNGHTKFLFAIRPAFGGGSYELMLSKSGSAPALGEESEAKVDFGQGTVTVDSITYKSTASGLAITRLRVPDTVVPQLKAAKEIRLSAFGAEQLISTGSLTPLMAALDTCARDLEKYWNRGVAHAVPAKPARDVRMAFSDGDYPQEALSRHRQGQSQYAVLVDPTGRIAGCDLLLASGIPSLDFMGCQVILKRVKFAGARDSSGRPVRDTYVTPPIRWAME